MQTGKSTDATIRRFQAWWANLCDLSGQKSPPQNILTKEAAAYTHDIPSYGNGTSASGISRIWTVWKWYCLKNIWEPLPLIRSRWWTSRMLQESMWWWYLLFNICFTLSYSLSLSFSSSHLCSPFLFLFLSVSCPPLTFTVK